MLGALGFTLYTSLRPAKDGEINSCVSSSTNWVVIQFCQQGLSLIKAFPVIWFSVATVVQTCEQLLLSYYDILLMRVDRDVHHCRKLRRGAGC